MGETGGARSTASVRRCRAGMQEGGGQPGRWAIIRSRGCRSKHGRGSKPSQDRKPTEVAEAAAACAAGQRRPLVGEKGLDVTDKENPTERATPSTRPRCRTLAASIWRPSCPRTPAPRRLDPPVAAQHTTEPCLQFETGASSPGAPPCLGPRAVLTWAPPLPATPMAVASSLALVGRVRCASRLAWEVGSRERGGKHTELKHMREGGSWRSRQRK